MERRLKSQLVELPRPNSKRRRSSNRNRWSCSRRGIDALASPWKRGFAMRLYRVLYCIVLYSGEIGWIDNTVS